MRASPLSAEELRIERSRFGSLKFFDGGPARMNHALPDGVDLPDLEAGQIHGEAEVWQPALQGAEVGLRMLQIPRVFSRQNRD